MSTTIETTPTPGLAIAYEFAVTVERWMFEDKELNDARASLPYEERDAAQEMKENARVRVSREALALAIIGKHLCPKFKVECVGDLRRAIAMMEGGK